MSLLIKNIDTVDVIINDLGITLAPSQEYDLTQDRPNIIATSTDLPAALTAGTVAVLDPLDDVTQLSLADGLAAVAAMNDTHFRIRGGALNQLEDVVLTTPTVDQMLIYNGSQWVNQDPAGGSTQNIWETITADTGSTTANTPTDTLTVTGPDGIATSITGDTLSINPANDLAAVEGLTTTGLAVRTTTDTWTTRTITGTADQITVTNGSGVAGNPLLALAPNTVIPGSEGLQIPSGTTAERPAAPAIGDMRFNTDLNFYEAWDGTHWVRFGGVPGSNVSELIYGQIPHLTGTTQIPYDDTPPLITEGTQFFSDTVTTATAEGKIVLWFSSTCSISNSNRIITVSLWRDTTLIGVFGIGAPSSNSPVIATGIVADAPGAAGTYTYSGRIGLSANATWYIGGFTSNANYGGAANTNNQYVIMRLE